MVTSTKNCARMPLDGLPACDLGGVLWFLEHSRREREELLEGESAGGNCHVGGGGVEPPVLM